MKIPTVVVNQWNKRAYPWQVTTAMCFWIYVVFFTILAPMTLNEMFKQYATDYWYDFAGTVFGYIIPLNNILLLWIAANFWQKKWDWFKGLRTK